MDLLLSLLRRRWDLERFGLTPGKLLRRAHPAAAPPVVSISLPQAGTHLTERTLCLHPAYYRMLARVNWGNPARLERLLAAQRPGQIICTHVPYSQDIARRLSEHAEVKTLFVVRDPRDSLVSTAHYVYNRPRHPWYDALRRYPQLRDRLSVLIEGDPHHGIPPIAIPLQRYAGWLNSNALVVRFEQLVGAGTRIDSIQQLFTHLGTPVDRQTAEDMGGRLVSPVSLTFRQGRIGEWQAVFDDSLRISFETHAGEWARRYGYT